MKKFYKYLKTTQNFTMYLLMAILAIIILNGMCTHLVNKYGEHKPDTPDTGGIPYETKITP